MDKAVRFLKEQFQSFENPTVVVACSGGPDSMALLHLCLQLRDACRLNIVCAHVNHNVRIESDSEQVFVERFCKENEVTFEYMKINTYSDDNFENEARIKRYTYFDTLVKQHKANYLLTAHHGDDLMETVLMRIVRGSTLKGYSGFSKIVEKKDYKILRPLIYYTKNQLIDYNNKVGIPFVIDKTNEMDIHTRNRYRKYILPVLKGESFNVHEKFLKFSETLSQYDTYLDKEVKQQKDQLYINNQIMDVVELLKLDKLLVNKIIDSILAELYQDDLMLLSDKHVELIYDLLNSNKANAYICLPHGINVVKEYNIAKFTKEHLMVEDYEFELVESVLLPNGKMIKRIEDENNNSNFICRLDSKDLQLPLIVRNRRLGDKMAIKGLNGRKKIKDIFINEKIPSEDRAVWPVVTDSSDTIVWLPGLKKSQFDKKNSQKYDIIIKYD